MTTHPKQQEALAEVELDEGNNGTNNSQEAGTAMKTTDTIVPQATDVTTYMCDSCGTPRYTKTTGRRRRLRCAGCGTTTAHSKVGGPAEDWREQVNQEDNVEIRELVRKINYIRDLLDELGYYFGELEDDERLTTDYKGNARHVGVTLHKSSRSVWLHPDLTLSGEARSLILAAEKLADPDSGTWVIFANRDDLLQFASTD